MHKVEGRYLLACDGGRSTIRIGLGVFMSGFTWGERFLVLTTEHDFAASDGYINRNYVMDPTEWLAVFKVPGDKDQGIWRTLFPTEGHEKDETCYRTPALPSASAAFDPTWIIVTCFTAISIR